LETRKLEIKIPARGVGKIQKAPIVKLGERQNFNLRENIRK
jgi:hypothetical protein